MARKKKKPYKPKKDLERMLADFYRESSSRQPKKKSKHRQQQAKKKYSSKGEDINE